MVWHLKSECFLSETDLQIQHGPYQNPTWVLGRDWQADPKNDMEMQGIQKSHRDLEKENKAGRFTF